MAANGNEMVELKVSDDLIRSIVTKQVTAAMLTAMGGREEFLEKIVTTVMTTKVDHEGKLGGWNKLEFQWLDVMVRQMIQQAAKEAIKAWIENNKPVIQKAIEKQFQKQTGSLAAVFMDGLIKSVSADWKFNVNVSFDSQKKC